MLFSNSPGIFIIKIVREFSTNLDTRFFKNVGELTAAEASKRHRFHLVTAYVVSAQVRDSCNHPKLHICNARKICWNSGG